MSSLISKKYILYQALYIKTLKLKKYVKLTILREYYIYMTFTYFLGLSFYDERIMPLLPATWKLDKIVIGVLDISTFKDKMTTTVKRYLDQLSRHPLIKEAEMKELGDKIEAMIALGVRPSKKRPNPFDYPEEDRQTIREGIKAFERFVEGNLPLVVFIAKRYSTEEESLLNYIQWGNLGLIKATEKFNFKRNTKFSTYAFRWIKQSIARGITNTERTIRLPIHINDRLSKIRRIMTRYSKEEGRQPTIKELALESNLTEAEVSFAIKSNHKYVLNSDILDIYAPEVVKDDLQEALDDVLSNVLDPLEYKIIKLYYGEQSKTKKEICNITGLSQDNINSIIEGSIQKVRMQPGLLPTFL